MCGGSPRRGTATPKEPNWRTRRIPALTPRRPAGPSSTSAGSTWRSCTRCRPPRSCPTGTSARPSWRRRPGDQALAGASEDRPDRAADADPGAVRATAVQAAVAGRVRRGAARRRPPGGGCGNHPPADTVRDYQDLLAPGRLPAVDLRLAPAEHDRRGRVRGVPRPQGGLGRRRRRHAHAVHLADGHLSAGRTWSRLPGRPGCQATTCRATCTSSTT